jgi:hypothetical protein
VLVRRESHAYLPRSLIYYSIIPERERMEPLPALLGATESIIAPKIRIAHLEPSTQQENPDCWKIEFALSPAPRSGSKAVDDAVCFNSDETIGSLATSCPCAQTRISRKTERAALYNGLSFFRRVSCFERPIAVPVLHFSD